MLQIDKLLQNVFKSITSSESVEKEQVLMASSICSDELNHTRQLYATTRSVFNLGGLAGYPYAGITGLNAFFDHIPDGGAALIIYGPHIGANHEGIHGIVHRLGQERETTSCGALAGVLELLQKGDDPNYKPGDVANLQFDFLMQRIHELTDQEMPPDMPTITRQMYSIIRKDLLQFIQQSRYLTYNFPLYLVGGTIVNNGGWNDFDVKDTEKAVQDGKQLQWEPFNL